MRVRWWGLASLAVGLTLNPATASAQPSDQQLLYDDFESGTLANWNVTRGGGGSAAVVAGIGSNGSAGARLTVPSYGAGSIAYLRHTPAESQRGISAAGRFRALSGGCAGDGTYANGSLPFLRLFDTGGRRVAGVYRINANCAKTTKLYVQHSGNFYRTGKNIALDREYSVELRASVSEPGRSLVQVYVDGALAYQSTTADNGIEPIASVTIHNEHADQVGDLVADDVRLARFDVAPFADPCDPAAPAPTTTDPGTTLLADAFETQGLAQWTTITRLGDASLNLQTEHVRSGRCAALLSVSATSGSKANLIRSLPAATSEIWADGFFNVLRPGAQATSNVPLMRLFGAGTRLVDVYRVNGDGALYLRTIDGGGGFVFRSLGRSMDLSRWYEVTLHAVAPENRVEVWLDRQPVGSVEVPFGTAMLEQAMIGSEHFAQEGDLAVDDFVLKRVP